MRLGILMFCALIATGVFAVVLFSTWRAHRRISPEACSRQSLAMELTWAVIPCLIIVAAALPAVIAAGEEGASELRVLVRQERTTELWTRKSRSAPADDPGAAIRSHSYESP